MNTAAVIEGLGTILPPRAVSNEELSKILDTSDDWIRTRTGIRQRFWVDPGTSTSDLAVDAGQRALKAAGVDSVDMVVLATTTPDHPCPATAPDVAARLGLGTAAAYDLSAVCAGFVFALAMGSSAIVAGLADRVLVIAAEVYSSILNPEDRTTAVIFGDGAGAVVLRAGTADEPGALLGFDLGSDGTHRELITIPAGGSRQKECADPADFFFQMQGKPVFANAVTRMGESSAQLLDRIGWPVDSVDRLVGHQANVRILHAVADHLGVDPAKAVINLDRVGNTSAASIPLALADATDSGELKPGDRVLMTAFGGGLSWGSTALVWPDINVV